MQKRFMVCLPGYIVFDDRSHIPSNGPVQQSQYRSSTSILTWAQTESSVFFSVVAMTCISQCISNVNRLIGPWRLSSTS